MAISAFRTCGFLTKTQSNNFVQKCRIFNTSCENLNYQQNRKRLLKNCLGIFSGAIATCGFVTYMLEKSVQAMGLELHPPNYCWAFNNLFTSFDHMAIRRGWLVYKNVQDGPDEEGHYFKRPGKLSDMVPSPFPNEEAARAANNGALPVDVSLIINARHNGSNYLFSLLTSYMDPPAGIELMDGQYFTPYFPGGAIGMAEIIQDDVMEYEDGTPTTRSQIAKDVVEFLTWTANPELDTRKLVALKVIIIGSILLAASLNIYRQKWSTLKSRKIYYVPKKKC